MKKGLLTTIALAAACMSLASCGNGGAKKTKIAIGLYTLTGNHKDALEAYLNSIKGELNVEFTYFETGYDGNTLLTAVEQQIAGGAKAIISTMDGGTAVVDACADANVYLAGYLCDYENSYEAIKGKKYFLGTAVDGAYRGTAWGEHIAERVIAEGKKNIGMIKFPSSAYPHQAEMDSAFRAKIAEYNATAEESAKITVAEQTTEMAFFGFDTQAYLASCSGCDAIYAMCGAVDSLYPAMTAEQKASTAIYTAGYNVNITAENDFGPDHCIQEMVYSNVEAITYPLIKIINKLNNKTYDDEPSVSARVETSQIIVQNVDDLQVVQAHSIYHTAKAKDAFLTVEQVKSLLAGEEGASEAKLVEVVQSMDIDDLRTLNNIA